MLRQRLQAGGIDPDCFVEAVLEVLDCQNQNSARQYEGYGPGPCFRGVDRSLGSKSVKRIQLQERRHQERCGSRL